MRKLALLMLLAVVSNSAMAEWSNVGRDNVATFYVDYSTIKKTRRTVTMWYLFDYKSPQGGNYLSFKSRAEFECDKQQFKQDFVSYYAGDMGNGAVRKTEQGTNKWVPIPPGSTALILWKAACIKTPAPDIYPKDSID
jgi:hypothetical protein